ncbi:MAG: serine/threonine-protein kinase, partial [Bacteroidota bacterium]
MDLETLFAEAAALDGAERNSFLDTHAPAGELRREVEDLLATYDDEPFFLDEPAIELRAYTGDFPEDVVTGDLSGRHVGGYRLVRLLGRGGMGEVYLAERDGTDFKQHVALKLIKRGMDTADVLRRFRTERQILATLDHPNIARVYDAGVTQEDTGLPGGLPYFVMPYIQGQPIDVYCNERKLSVLQRLRLFEKVCGAVHYAHQNLIVHRDLKPSNIVVDASGEPFLLDFGIAKMLNPAPQFDTVAETRTHARLMTPDFASPEQVRGSAVTTASDVYALGLLLYLLLTGRRAYHLAGHSPAEIERIVTETDPVRPSVAAVSPGSDDVPDVSTRATQRNTSPERLRKALHGDLDTILRMATRKEPHRRYASAQALADDLRKVRLQLPVSARSDTFTYRAGKFVRRHTVGVALGGLFALLITGFGVVSALQAKTIAAERDRAQEVSSFLVELFKNSDPRQSAQAPNSARYFLDIGAMRLENELAAQHALRAELQEVMSHAYTSLGHFEDAEAMARESLAASLTADSADFAGRSDALMALGHSLFYKALFDEAEEVYREALRLRQQTYGQRHASVAEALNHLAKPISARADYATASALLEQALALRTALLGASHLAVAESQNDLGQVLFFSGDAEKALPLLSASLTTRRDKLGDNHPDVAESLDDLAAVLSQLGQYDRAEPLYAEALDVRQSLFGESHLEVAESLYNLALLNQAQGDLTPADSLMRAALEMDIELLGNAHPYVGNCFYHLGAIARDAGRLNVAQMRYRDALKIYRGSLPETHPFIANALVGLSDALL